MYMGEVKYFKENFGQNNFESLNKKNRSISTFRISLQK